METRFSQGDAARRLNVDKVRSTNSGININPKILRPKNMLQADHEFQHLQKTVIQLFSAGKKRRNTVMKLVAPHFLAIGKESSLLRCEDLITMQICMQGEQLCVCVCVP